MKADDASSAPLARAIYEGYPASDLLPVDDDDLVSLKALYARVIAPPGVSDSLLRFIVIEAYEVATDGGVVNLARVAHLLDRGEEALLKVRCAVEKLEQSLEEKADAEHRKRLAKASRHWDDGLSDHVAKLTEKKD